MILHTKPRVFVEDISVSTGLKNDVGIIKYSVDIAGLEEKDEPFCQVTLLDENDVSASMPFYGTQGTLRVSSPRLWWPRSMSSDAGYMYTLEVFFTIILLLL